MISINFAILNETKMNKSSITIDVSLDENRIPSAIEWNASDSRDGETQKARSMMLAFWDGAEKTALRIDLWTKEMTVEEMADFFYQTLMTMADTYSRATQYDDQAEEMKKFAGDFFHKFQRKQTEQNKI